MSFSCLEPVRVRHGDDYVYVPCGHCKACCYNKQSDWSTRLSFESKSYPKGSVLFVGLSYNQDHLPEYTSLCKRDLQLFMKRLRKFISPRKCRFFACGEYGEEFGRPHYHIILFGVTRLDLKLYSDFYSRKLRGTVAFSKLWSDQKGNPIGRVTIQDIHPIHFSYVAKYAGKKFLGKSAQDFEDFFGVIPEFIQMSRNPGIGREECERRIERLRRDGAIWIKPGVYRGLPKYFVNLVFPNKESLDYRDWCDRRLQFRQDKQAEFDRLHPNLTNDEARALMALQTLRRIETMERKKGHVKRSFYDILAESLERSAFARYEAFFAEKIKQTDC